MKTIIALLLCTANLVAESEVKEIDYHKQVNHYRIQNGDTLARIALKYHVSVSFILSINSSIHNPNQIYIGQKIKVPNELTKQFIMEKSLNLKPLLDQLGASKSKMRIKAVKEMIRQDWRVIPLLLKALKDKDVEVRENAREALREIHKSHARVSVLQFDISTE